MPLDSAVGFSAAMLAVTSSGSFQSFDTLSVVFKDGTVRHYSTLVVEDVADVAEFGTVDFQDGLREVGSFDESLTLEVDGVEIGLANVDGEISSIALGGSRTLNGAKGVLGTIIRSLAGVTYWQEVARGEIFNASDPDPDARFTLVFDMSVPGPVAADRALQQHCTVPKFGGPGCSSPSAGTCSRLLDDANGCRSKLPAIVVINGTTGNDARFQGFRRRAKPLSGEAIQDPGGSFDAGGDFNSYRLAREEAGGYVGRNPVPEQPVV